MFGVMLQKAWLPVSNIMDPERRLGSKRNAALPGSRTSRWADSGPTLVGLARCCRIRAHLFRRTSVFARWPMIFGMLYEASTKCVFERAVVQARPCFAREAVSLWNGLLSRRIRRLVVTGCCAGVEGLIPGTAKGSAERPAVERFRSVNPCGTGRGFASGGSGLILPQEQKTGPFRPDILILLRTNSNRGNE
jgi:hypothetical protein